MSSMLTQSAAGQVSPVALRRTAQIVNTIIPANSTLPISQAGLGFYIIAASYPVDIRPSGGSFNAYYTGTGGKADPLNGFSGLEVRNNSNNPITLSLWVGFGDYIDNRLIQVSDLFNTVVYPTYPVASAASNLLIPDLTGQKFTDINGNLWLALNRISILITNFDTANAMPLKDSANAVGSIFACLPNTSAILNVSGDYRITLGSTPLNCVVSEIYNAITPTLG